MTWYQGQEFYIMEMNGLDSYAHTRYFVVVVQTYNDLVRISNFCDNWRGKHLKAREIYDLKYWSGRRDDYEHKVKSGVWDPSVPVLKCTVREFFEHINYDFSLGCFI